jgi:hypothetical protein
MASASEIFEKLFSAQNDNSSIDKVTVLQEQLNEEIFRRLIELREPDERVTVYPTTMHPMIAEPCD